MGWKLGTVEVAVWLMRERRCPEGRQPDDDRVEHEAEGQIENGADYDLTPDAKLAR